MNGPLENERLAGEAHGVTLQCGMRLVVCGKCPSSLYNNTAELHSHWSEYQLTVHAVARLHVEDASVDEIQSQVDAVRQAVDAVNDSTSVYSNWNHLSGQLSRINDSLQAVSTQVSSYIFIFIHHKVAK